MTSKTIKYAVVVCCLISIMSGFVSWIKTVHRLTAIYPISETNNPERFCVIGLDQTNKLFLLYKKKSDKSDTPLAYDANDDRESTPINYYISKQILQSVKQQLDEAIADESGGSPYWTSIKILNDDPVKKKQIIRLYLGLDDYDYWYVYFVDRDSIYPLEYADITLRDTAESAVSGFMHFLVVLLSGLLIILIIHVSLAARSKYIKRKMINAGDLK